MREVKKVVKQEPVRASSLSKDELAKANEGLNSLNKGDIVEMKALNNPPAAVMKCMGAVMLLLGKDDSWATVKQTISGP